MLYLDQTVGKEYWHELNTGNHLENNHTVKEILEHIESKCNKEEHIDVERVLETINEQPSFESGLQGYWQRQIAAQQRCKNTEEPISDHTLKRIALGHLRKIGPLQSKVTKWEREKDPNKKASFIELRDWFSAEERILRRNRQALGEIGIANSVEIKELDNVNLQLEAHQEALQKIIQHQREVQQAMNVNNKENETVAPTKEKESSNDDKLLEKILAALENKQEAPKKETKLEQLEKQIKALKQANNNNGGGNSNKGKGKGGPPERKPVKKMKCYCSTHGVNPTHENDNCNNKQSWHKDGATFENKKGGNTHRANLWHDASITLEQCYMDKIE